MRTWHFYDLETGRFTGQQYGGTFDDGLAASTPPGCGAYEGAIDWRNCRVDIATGQLIEQRPEPPTPSAQWSDSLGQWVDLRAIEITEARANISRLEGQQARALRELALADVARKAAAQDVPGVVEALESSYAQAAYRLAELDRQIREHRGIINGSPT